MKYLVDEPSAVGGFGHVANQSVAIEVVFFQLLNRFVDFVLFAAADDHFGAFSCQSFGNRKADSVENDALSWPSQHHLRLGNSSRAYPSVEAVTMATLFKSLEAMIV